MEFKYTSTEHSLLLLIFLFFNFRAERQRNVALYNAEELSKAFQHYKEKVAEKLEKVRGNCANSVFCIVRILKIKIDIEYLYL